MDRRALWRRALGWRSDPLLDTPPGRLVLILLDVEVRDRALGLAGQAFIALLPLVIVLATWLSAADGMAVGNWLINRFSLTGSAAAAVNDLFSQPPEATSAISWVGLAILVVSVNSFSRSLQRTFESAWGLPRQFGGGPRRRLVALGAVALMIALMTTLTWFAGLVRDLPVGWALVVPTQLAVSIPTWCLITWLLLMRRVAWLSLLPGAVLLASALLLTAWGGTIWVPYLIERNTGRYGVVGVAVAMISWLVVLAFVLVAGAALGAWAGTWLQHSQADAGAGAARLLRAGRSGVRRRLPRGARRRRASGRHHAGGS